MNNSRTLPVIITIIVLILVCCLCICLVSVVAYFRIADSTISTGDYSDLLEETTPTPVVIRPSSPTPPAPPDPPGATPPADDPVQPDPPSSPGMPDAPGFDPAANYQVLSNARVPPQDPYDLARRLKGIQGVSPTLEPPTAFYQVGERSSFWVSDTDTNDYFQVQATLRQVTDHAYFWIEDSVDYRQDDLEALAQAFEEQIYPTNREFFGSEWTPGVDGDPHIYILYAGDLGGNIAGYFSSTDSYNPAIQKYSNGHEMFVFNSDLVYLDEEYTYGVLSHEFHHMIHWYLDHNESTWMNEGFSELATFLNGYDTGGHDFLFSLDTDLQLNDWGTDIGDNTPHYGASFLFFAYFLDRFGDEATQALVAHPDDDLRSIDKVLAEQNITDPLTDKIITADDFFADWTIATFVRDESISDGRYTYHNYPGAPQPPVTESIDSCDDRLHTRDVRQYGTEYIQIDCRQDTILNFEGSILTNLLPASPHSGSYAFWSNKGDESDMTLTRRFDFTDQSGPLSLEYWTWYDIEEDFDYVYLLASEDGENWETLFTPSGTGDDPTGSNYGWGYNGLSGEGPEWIAESVDISKFAGKQVSLRFEYITDAAVNGEGLMVDDITIPEIGYATDFEADEGGWEAAGFVRVQNVLPQSFRLTLITYGDQTTVQSVELNRDNSASIPLDFGEGVEEAVLVVSGTTRYTRQPAAYRFSFQRP